MNWYNDIEDDEDEALVLPCTKCGRPIYEDSDYCTECGEFVSIGSTRFMSGMPIWMQGLWLTLVAVLIYQMMAMGCIG